MDSILSNKALVVPLAAWLVAQVLKTLILLIRNRRLNLSYITYGGMPSAHTTLVCALATSIAIVYGFQSAAFAVSTIFAAVVMYDAAGVRQTVSAQSAILNRILDELFKGKPAFEQRFREFIGHTRLEVVVGAALGILLAWLWT